MLAIFFREIFGLAWFVGLSYDCRLGLGLDEVAGIHGLTEENRGLLTKPPRFPIRAHSAPFQVSAGRSSQDFHLATRSRVRV